MLYADILCDALNSVIAMNNEMIVSKIYMLLFIAPRKSGYPN